MLGDSRVYALTVAFLVRNPLYFRYIQPRHSYFKQEIYLKVINRLILYDIGLGIDCEIIFLALAGNNQNRENSGDYID